MKHGDNSSISSCENFEDCHCKFDDREPTDGCYFKDVLIKDNDYTIEFRASIPKSVLSDKLTVITTNAKLKNDVEDLGTDTMMSIVAYTNNGALLWSHRQDQNGQSLSRYIKMSPKKDNATTTDEDEIPIKLIFSSTTKQELTLTVSLELKDIDIGINRKKMGTLKSGSPIVYKFDNKENTKHRQVRVSIWRSDIKSLREKTQNGEGCSMSSQNCFCSIATIQPLKHLHPHSSSDSSLATAPFHQIESDVIFHSLWQNMIGRSVINVDVGGSNENEFSKGFYIVILKREDDMDCRIGEYYARKYFAKSRSNDDSFEYNIEISNTEGDLWGKSLFIIVLYCGILIVMLVISKCFKIPITGKVCIPEHHNPFTFLQMFFPKVPGDGKGNRVGAMVHEPLLGDINSSNVDGFYIDIDDHQPSWLETNPDGLKDVENGRNTNDMNSNIRKIFSIESKKSFRVVKIPNEGTIIENRKGKNAKLKDFATLCDPELFSSSLYMKSDLYFWILMIAGVFYTIPTSQLIFGVKRMSEETGSRDMCYYNYLCKSQTNSIDDYGNIFSNIAYIFAGVCFIVLVCIRRSKRRNAMIELYWKTKYPDQKLDKKTLKQATKTLSEKNVEFLNQRGIPEQYGIFFAMGGCTILQGVLSGLYHVCPVPETFQFDTTFMYISCMLGFLKLYQFRHPDVTGNAHLMVSGITVPLILEVFGYHLPPGTVFALAFVGGYMSILIIPMILQIADQKGISYSSKSFKGLILGVNLPLAGLFAHLTGKHATDSMFSEYLLVICLVNVLAYLVYYAVMKYYYVVKLRSSRESIPFKTYFYGILTIIFFGIGLYFFGSNEKDFTLSSSESRHLNNECMFWFFDYHDIWHFASGLGLLFLNLVLLTLEDNNTSTPWNEIPVF